MANGSPMILYLPFVTLLRACCKYQIGTASPQLSGACVMEKQFNPSAGIPDCWRCSTSSTAILLSHRILTFLNGNNNINNSA